MKKFNKINIEISNVCNLQCSFCPEVERRKGFMSINLFRRILDQIAPLTDLVCFHLMGDPSIHPQLPEFFELCAEFGVRVNFVTNGVLLRESLQTLLLHSSLYQVNFSLHSFADNFGDKNPDRYLEKIFKYTERAFVERPDLYINYRIWDLASVDGRSNRHTKILTEIENRFDVVIPRNPDIRRHKGRNLRGRLYVHFDTQFIWPDLALPELGSHGTCHGLSTHFGILVDGTVVPCCLDKEAAIPLGNIERDGIHTILAGSRAIAILEGFRQRRLVEALCQRCQYIERFKRPQEKLV